MTLHPVHNLFFSSHASRFVNYKMRCQEGMVDPEGLILF